jgi:hypothetical protein
MDHIGSSRIWGSQKIAKKARPKFRATDLTDRPREKADDSKMLNRKMGRAAWSREEAELSYGPAISVPSNSDAIRSCFFALRAIS